MNSDAGAVEATHRPRATASVRQRANALRAEILSTRERARRIAVALQHKENSLARLEPLIANSGDDVAAPITNEPPPR